MKSMLTASILAAAALTAATLAGSPAVAAQTSIRETVAEHGQTRTVTNLDERTIAEADEFVSAKGGTLTFDESRASSLSAGEKKQVQAAVDEWNQNLKAEDQGAQAQAEKKQIDAQKATVVKGKHGYIEAHWWGLKIHVDAYLKGKIQSGAATAAAIAAGIGLTSSSTGVGGVAGGIVSAALAGAAGIIGVCSEEDGDVTFYQAATGGAPVCNPLA